MSVDLSAVNTWQSCWRLGVRGNVFAAFLPRFGMCVSMRGSGWCSYRISYIILWIMSIPPKNDGLVEDVM